MLYRCIITIHWSISICKNKNITKKRDTGWPWSPQRRWTARSSGRTDSAASPTATIWRPDAFTLSLELLHFDLMGIWWGFWLLMGVVTADLAANDWPLTCKVRTLSWLGLLDSRKRYKNRLAFFFLFFAIVENWAAHYHYLRRWV